MTQSERNVTARAVASSHTRFSPNHRTENKAHQTMTLKCVQANRHVSHQLQRSHNEVVDVLTVGHSSIAGDIFKCH